MSYTDASGSYDTALSHGEAWKTIFRVLTYFRFLKFRVTTKIAFISTEIIFRIMFLPWALKIVVDNVILNQPIDSDGGGFPSYIAPLISPLHGMPPTEIMFWMFVIGVLIVVLFGMTPNRATGVSVAGNISGVRAGSVGQASAELAGGQDTATQTENSANGAVSEMGGLLGLLDFHVHLRLSQSLNHLLRAQIAAHLKSLPVSDLEEQRIGDSTYRVIYDSTSCGGIFDAIVIYTIPGILMIVMTYSILSTSFSAASELIFIAFVVGASAYLLVAPLTGIVSRLSQASRLAGSNMTSNIEEGMSNLLVIQSLGGNKQESSRFDAISAESFKQFRFQIFAQLSMGKIGSLAFLAGQISFFVVMSGYVIDGTYTAGDYFVVNYYFFVLSAVCYGFGTMFSELQPDIAGMARVFRILDAPAEKNLAGTELQDIQKGLTMRQVNLIYPDGRQILNKVSLEINPGEMVALVGPAGAGKTSLAYLIPGFLQATSGQICIGGINIKSVTLNSLRNHVSYIFQETQLLSDSIINNIRYGKPSAPTEEVEVVARIAGAHDFITSLPEGYETQIGTVIDKLSVGQKQRISIARGLLKPAEILILDEPTSALDPETEQLLIDALKEAAQQKTVLVIAHRLSTITHADRIYFLDEGKILESGSHEDLISIPAGKYRRYAELQARSE